jgi:predicted nucleic acid-binding protein
MDDRAARQIATQRGLLIAGTAGILEQAAGNGLLNLSESLQRLLSTNFRIKTEVVREVLDRDAARRRITGPRG